MSKESEKFKIINLVTSLENPYPYDIFKWDNPEKLNFTRGRFNQHCFEVWENCRTKLLEKLGELEE
jgi:hypothetical protein